MHQGLPELDEPVQLPTPCPIRQRISDALGNATFRFYPDQKDHHFLIFRPERTLNVNGLVASLNGKVSCRTNAPHTLYLVGDGEAIAELVTLFRH